MFLQMLQESSAGRVHDALRNSGGAGGEQDVERVRKGKLPELKRPDLKTFNKLLQRPGIRD